jgi:hypothetical protein
MWGWKVGATIGIADVLLILIIKDCKQIWREKDDL